ncbi:MAG: adenylate/guanylate cyclase domain-containing protein [Syntrophaceae bacterium]|nr:adenylate/guanylate cyclase domain-containing protein [Syntrophaceae bacterium]
MKDKLGKLLTISPLTITIAITFVIVVLFFVNPPFLHFMELKTLDLRMVSRGKVAPLDAVVIATVDEKSLSELGRWPWPRTTMAGLVDKLKKDGARAVGFDIVFAEPDENSSLKALGALQKELRGAASPAVMKILERKRAGADTDSALARAMEKAENVSLGYFFHLSKKDVAHITEDEAEERSSLIASSRYQIVEARPGAKPDDNAFIHAFTAEPNLPAVSEAGQNSGYFNAFPDADGVIRWSPLVIRMGDNFYHPLSLALLQQYFEWEPLILQLADFGVEGIRIGDVQIPTDEAGRILINYLGPGKTFPHYAISDILNGRLDPDTFKDKIVIVGATAIGIYDLRVTPFSSVYPGVEIHATVIDNILRKNFLQRTAWTSLVDFLSIIGLGLLIGLVLPRFNAVRGLLFSAVVLAGFIVVNTLLFTRMNAWLNLIYPVLVILTVYVGVTVYRYITEEREKQKIRGAFQYYLTASVINEMLKDPTKLKLGGDKKNLTVLFSDIRGFTTISEKLSPEELVHLLNEYLTAMTDLVFKYNGLLDKYMGDAIMAVWGAPLDQPDHAERACRTALEMLDELKKLQNRWESEGRPRLDIGVGINTGDMVVGNMGSQMRFDYTVMGDSVNLGSRLEGINKEYGTNIVVSEFTYETVKDRFFCRELDSVRVKGKKLPVRIYELLGEQRDADRWVRWSGVFEEGLARYKEGRWDEAIALFRQVLNIKHGDPPSELYISRCESLKEHPPEGEWDGVFTMTRK